jgi:DNA-directed RNA polymerase subunit RPC12/RpoP
MLIDDIKELHRVIQHASCNPRVADIRCERHAELDMSAAPTGCPACGERFLETRPRHWWRVCACGGHWVYACIACGASQLYPRLEDTCQ